MTKCDIQNNLPYWNNVNLQPTLEAGIRYWFTSDFDTDTTLRNKSPYSVGNGTIINAIRQSVHQSGVFGSCLSYNGAGYTQLPTAVLSGQQRFTISSWFKTTSSNLSLRLYYEGSSTSITPLAALTINDAVVGEVKFGIRDNAGVIGSISSTNNTALDGKWHNIVGLCKSSSARELYFDGILIASNTTPTLGISTLNTSNIGAQNRSDGYKNYFTGLIGETIISTSTYTPTDIYYNYTHSPFYYIQKEEL